MRIFEGSPAWAGPLHYYDGQVQHGDDSALRRPWVTHIGTDRLERLNQTTQLEWSVIAGRPGYDYQNPRAWQAQTMLAIWNKSIAFDWTYQAVDKATGLADLARNVAASRGMLGPGGA